MSIKNILVENYIYKLGIMQKHQLDNTLYDEWSKIMTALFKCSRRLWINKEWTSLSEMRTLPEYTEIYELVQKAFDLIGDVNGYPLRRDDDVGILIVAYTSAKQSDKDAEKVDSTKSKAIFRLRLEHYFARKIMEQQSKIPAMLADDIEDRRLVRRLKNRIKRQIPTKRLNCQPLIFCP